MCDITPLEFFHSANVNVKQASGFDAFLPSIFSQAWPQMIRKRNDHYEKNKLGTPKPIRFLLFTDKIELFDCQLQVESTVVTARTMHKQHIREAIDSSDENVHIILINPTIAIIHLIREYRKGVANLYALKLFTIVSSFSKIT